MQHVSYSVVESGVCSDVVEALATCCVDVGNDRPIVTSAPQPGMWWRVEEGDAQVSLQTDLELQVGDPHERVAWESHEEGCRASLSALMNHGLLGSCGGEGLVLCHLCCCGQVANLGLEVAWKRLGRASC